MDDENQNLNDTTNTNQTSGAEKVEKAGNAAAKGVKAGKITTKILSSLKGMGILGTLAVGAIIAIIILVLLVGIIAFFLEMPGLMTNKLSEIAENIFMDIRSIYEGNSAYITADKQKELAQYLENMGYPPYEYGFGRYKDQNGNYIDDSQVTDDSTIESKYLNAYLTADYNTYVKRDKTKESISNFLHTIRNGVGYILGMQPDNQEADFGMLVIDDSTMGWFDSVETNTETKTLTFKMKESLFRDTYYTYNMEGWTARYGKPLELSITLHLVTMAPDLVYRFDMDQEEDTKINIKVTDKFTANIKFNYHITDETVTTNFAQFDSSLADIDQHVQNDKKLTVEDLQKLKDYMDSNQQYGLSATLQYGYNNFKSFLDNSVGNDDYVLGTIKQNQYMQKRYDGTYDAGWLGIDSYDYSISNFLGQIDQAIEKLRQNDSSISSYAIDQGYSGYMDYYAKKISPQVTDSYVPYVSNPNGMPDEVAQSILEKLQDGFEKFMQDGDKKPLETDIALIQQHMDELEENNNSENSNDNDPFYDELEKIGLTGEAVEKAVEYNNAKGEGEGTDIDRVQPYITTVEDHWYRDIIFEDGNYSAYDYVTNVSSDENVFNPDERSDDSALAPTSKGAFYTQETVTGGNIKKQVQDAIRGEVNEHTKELFVGTDGHPAKYFIYDGSENTAEKIDELREVYNSAYNNSWNIFRSDKRARQAAEDAVEAKEDQDGTNFYKEVNVKQNALSAFSILENSKSEDSDYILRDLKSLFVELGYFTKDDLRESDTHVFQWPISGYVNTYWPQRRFEKQQTDYGTLIRSITSTNNIRAGLNADGSERTEEQTQAYVYGPNYDANSTSATPPEDSGVTDTNDEENTDEVSNPTNTLIDGFETDLNVVSPVTGEILEEGDDYIKIKVLDTSAISEYEEFYNEYKGICTGYIMYIRGFQKETINANSESDYQKVEHNINYFIANGFADDYRDAQKYKDEFDDEEQKRIDAPAYLEKDGKRYIKEGTVIGTTTNSDIGLYLINRENSMVEDVESYIRLVKAGLETDWAYFYWVPYESGGIDGEGNGPEAVGQTTPGELAVGIAQWTSTNKAGGVNNIPDFCAKAVELNPSLCSELQQFVGMSVNEIVSSENAIRSAFKSICQKDRDGFTEVQMQVAIQENLTEPLTGTDREWLLDMSPVTQGTYMSTNNWSTIPSRWFAVMSPNYSDEENVRALMEKACTIGSTAGNLSSRWTSQYVLAKDILDGTLDEDGLMTWIKTKQPYDKYGEGKNMNALN